MMKYLFILPTDQLGGAEQLMKLLCSELIRTGHSVRVLILTQKKSLGWQDLGGNVKYIDTPSFMKGLLKMKSHLPKDSLDVVFASQVYINGLLGFFRSQGRLKTRRLVLRESTSVFLRYSKVQSLKFRFFYWLGYKQCDLVVHQSEVMKNQFLEHLSLGASMKHVILGNPIDIEGVKRLSQEEVELPSFPFILGVGRLISDKGFDIALRSFAGISKYYPSLHYVILGEGPDRVRLLQLSKELDIQEKVHLLGFNPNPYPYMRNAFLCVMSSRIEGYPNVLLQMLSLNDRVITTDCAGGITELPITYIASPNDVDSLSLAIKNGLSNDSLDSERVEIELSKRTVVNYLSHLNEILFNTSTNLNLSKKY